MPRFDSRRCDEGCAACAEICPTGAIVVRAEPGGSQTARGRLWTLRSLSALRRGLPDRRGLHFLRLGDGDDRSFRSRIRRRQRKLGAVAETLAEPRKDFRRSLHIRHVDAGSCNGCESELQALNNPFYNLHRFGIFFTAFAAICRSAARHRSRHLRDARAACFAPTRRCLSRDGSWRSALARYRAA